jgi:hypothetical protein
MPVPMKTAGSLELPDGEARMPPDKGKLEIDFYLVPRCSDTVIIL